MHTLPVYIPGCRLLDRRRARPACPGSPEGGSGRRLGSYSRSRELECQVAAGHSSAAFEPSVAFQGLPCSIRSPIRDGLKRRTAPSPSESPGRRYSPGAGDPSTGMGAGSAEIQAFDRRPVAGPTWHGSEDEGLVQSHLAVIDVSFRQTEPLLQIGGREDLPAEDQSA